MKKCILAILLCLSVLFLFACHDTPPDGPDDQDPTEKKDPVVTVQESAIDVKTSALFSKKTYNHDGYALQYQMYLPENYDGETYEYPVVLFLHGAGERGDDNELQLKNAVQNLFNDLDSPIYQSIFIAPQCPAEEQWVNTPWAEGNYEVDEIAESDALAATVAMLEQLQKDYSVNSNRIYVMGLSMGGFGTWDLLARHSDVFAAAIPICGGGDLSYTSLFAEKPIYTFHGTADTTVPFSGTQALANSILYEMNGELLTFIPVEDAGHNVWDYASTYEGLMDWLFAQSLPTIEE